MSEKKMNDNFQLFSWEGHHRIILYVIFAVILTSFVLRVIALNYRYFNEDEVEHLHVGYLISTGEVPYRDFFEHHLPVFHYLVSILYTFIKSENGIIFFSRWSMFIIVLFIYFITYKIAERIFNKDTGWLSLFFLSSSILFFEKSIEIRPDVPQSFLWLLSLYTLIVGFIKRKHIYPCLSGLFLGVAFTFTQKTVYVFTPVIVTLFIWLLLSHEKKIFLVRMRFSLLFMISFSVPILSLFGYFVIIDVFEDFFQWNFVKATIWGREIYPWEYMQRTMRQNSPFWILGLGNLSFFFCTNIRKWRENPELIVMPLSVFFLLIAMLLTSGPYKQTYMPILPIIAIFAGQCFQKGLSYLKEITKNHGVLLPFSLVIFFAISLPPFAEIADETEVSNQEQLEIIDFVHKITKSEDAIFDGWGFGTKRPSAFYYHMLTVGVVNIMGKESREQKIKESIVEHNTKVMIYDYRVKTYLPQTTQDFLKDNFLPMDFYDIRVVGKKMDRDSVISTKGIFNLISDARYRIQINGIENNILIDGKIVDTAKPIFLTKGEHQITLTGFYDEVTIRYDYETPFLNLP